MNTSCKVSLITRVDDALPARQVEQRQVEQRQREQRQVEQQERRRDHPVNLTAPVEDATLDQRRRRGSGNGREKKAATAMLTAMMIKKCRLPACALGFRNRKNTVACYETEEPNNQSESFYALLCFRRYMPSGRICRLILRAGEPVGK